MESNDTFKLGFDESESIEYFNAIEVEVKVFIGQYFNAFAGNVSKRQTHCFRLPVQRCRRS